MQAQPVSDDSRKMSFFVWAYNLTSSAKIRKVACIGFEMLTIKLVFGQFSIYLAGRVLGNLDVIYAEGMLKNEMLKPSPFRGERF
jgi:hypothetical protein